MNRGRASLRTQLIGWNVATLAVLLVALGATVRMTVQARMMAAIDRDLSTRLPMALPRRRWERGPGRPPDQDRSQSGRAPGRAGGPPPGQPPPGQPPADEPRPGRGRMGGGGAWRPRFFPVGEVLPAAPPVSAPGPWDGAARRRGAGGWSGYTTISAPEGRLRVFTRSYRVGGRVVMVAQTAQPLAEVTRALAELTAALLTLLPLGLLAAGTGGWLLTQRMLSRVEGLASAARAIGAPGAAARLPVVGQDEFARMATEFNGLLGRLDDAFARQQILLEQQRRFTADASHELKTPLTVIKGSAGLALDQSASPDDTRKALAAIDSAATAMTRLVQDLLLLAQSDEGRLGRDRIDLPLRDILQQAASATRREGSARVDDGAVPPDVVVHGNEDQLVRLFANLLENAIRFTPADGSIAVCAHREGRRVVVEVSDTGPGVDAAHLGRLGERFYRVDVARARESGGTGLGLAICRSIVEAHGGSIALQSAPGEGLTVRVSLPAD